MDGHGKSFSYFALFTEIGLVLFVTTLGAALAGHWADGQFETTPLFLTLGFFGGAFLGAALDWRLIRRFLKVMDD